MHMALYSQELADKICNELETGDKSLRQIARELGMSHSTIITWARDREDFHAQYARAREVGDDAQFERLEDLSSEAPQTMGGMVDSGWVSWKKNQIDTFKWCLARKRPKKYGDKLAMEVTGEVSLAERVQKAREKAANDTD